MGLGKTIQAIAAYDQAYAQYTLLRDQSEKLRKQGMSKKDMLPAAQERVAAYKELTEHKNLMRRATRTYARRARHALRKDATAEDQTGGGILVVATLESDGEKPLEVKIPLGRPARFATAPAFKGPVALTRLQRNPLWPEIESLDPVGATHHLKEQVSFHLRTTKIAGLDISGLAVLQALPLALLCFVLVPTLNGCIIAKLRKLRSDVEMREARILQLQQDYDAKREETQEYRTKADELGLKLAAKELEITDLRSNLRNAEASLSATRGTLEASKAPATAPVLDQIQKDLEATKLSEAELVNQREKIAALEGSVALAQESRISLEAQIREARADAEKLRVEIDKLRRVAVAGDSDSSDTIRLNLEVTASQRLASQIKKGGVILRGNASALRIIVLNDELFQPRSLDLSDAGIKTLRSIASTIVAVPPSRVVVVGHTDDVPVKNNPQYQDNWELSAVRASRVAGWLSAQNGLESRKLSVEARAFQDPIVNKTDSASRRLNRRVEVVLYP